MIRKIIDSYYLLYQKTSSEEQFLLKLYAYY